VAERLKAAVLKTAVRVSVPWVRIPPHPPTFTCSADKSELPDRVRPTADHAWPGVPIPDDSCPCATPGDLNKFRRAPGARPAFAAEPGPRPLPDHRPTPLRDRPLFSPVLVVTDGPAIHWMFGARRKCRGGNSGIIAKSRRIAAPAPGMIAQGSRRNESGSDHPPPLVRLLNRLILSSQSTSKETP
jgi:hypothetical protein